MSVISSKRRVILNRLQSMTSDEGVIKICEDLCSDADHSDLIAEERKRQLDYITAESSANAQKCEEFTIQIKQFRITDIKQRREIESLRITNGGYKNELEEWARKCENLQNECDRLIDELASLKEVYEEEGRQKVILVGSFKELQWKYDIAVGEVKSLELKLLNMQQILGLRNRSMFGSDSEKLSSLFGWDGTDRDPLDEDMPEPRESDNEVIGTREGDEGSVESGETAGTSLLGMQYSAEAATKDIEERLDGVENGEPDGSGEIGGITDGEDKGGKDKKKPRRSRKDTASKKAMLVQLPNVFKFDYDFADLDHTYGEGNYVIIGFDWRYDVRETKPMNYVYNYYKPIVKIIKGEDEGSLYMEGFERNFYPGSFASASLVARILYKRFCLALPLYRQEQEYRSRNVPISRQTMSNWEMHFCGWDQGGDKDEKQERQINKDALFVRVFERLRQELDLYCIVRQCDETTWRVVVWPDDSDKKNGSIGYLWEHTSGEFFDGHKVTIYVFEESRSTDHLREYLNGLTLFLVSDAYAAYFTIEKESGGKIVVANCWMHMRKKMAEAYIATKDETKDLEIDEFKEYPAVKGLLLANEVFRVEKPLRELSCEERMERREEEVAPKVDAFFEYIHKLEKKDLTGKVGEAVTYGINHEESLRVFLEDGAIPIDNGKAERGFKDVAIGRRNSLFSFSIRGAQSNAIMYSVVATAKANGADVYTYLKYLLEEIKPRLEDNDSTVDDDMTPWSQKYKEYEKSDKAHADERVPESNLPPEGIAFKIKSLAGVSPCD